MSIYGSLSQRLVRFLLLGFLWGMSPVNASNTDPHDDAAYKKGVILRQQGKFEEALQIFKPLAEKGNAKAQHNAGTCCFHLGDELNAFEWFQKASKAGMSESRKNITRLNLLFLLLPDEMMGRIMDFLDLKSLFRFKSISKRAQELFKHEVTRVNFLNSINPYAKEFFQIFFQDVTFDPVPDSIHLLCSAETSQSSIEVHFRDTTHLNAIILETPLIESKDKLYFVKDAQVKDGSEFVAPAGTVEKKYFLYIRAPRPLQMTGRIDIPVPYSLVFPRGTKIDGSHFNFKTRSGTSVLCGVPPAEENALALIKILDNFDHTLFARRTKDAEILLENCRLDREKHPNSYPSLSTLCPNSFLHGDDGLKLTQFDNLNAGEPFVYLAPTISDLQRLRKRLKEFGKSIGYIDPALEQAGVYCEGPLITDRGFKILSPGDLTMSGTVYIPYYNLKIECHGKFWCLTTTLHGKSLTTAVLKKTYIGAVGGRQKKEGVSDIAWKKLLEFWDHQELMLRPRIG